MSLNFAMPLRCPWCEGEGWIGCVVFGDTKLCEDCDKAPIFSKNCVVKRDDIPTYTMCKKCMFTPNMRK